MGKARDIEHHDFCLFDKDRKDLSDEEVMCKINKFLDPIKEDIRKVNNEKIGNNGDSTENCFTPAVYLKGLVNP